MVTTPARLLRLIAASIAAATLTLLAPGAFAQTVNNTAQAAFAVGGTLANAASNTVSAQVSQVRGAISGRVWLDADHDSYYTPGTDPGVGNWVVRLYDSSDTQLAEAITAPDGTYAIPNVAPGSGYRLRFFDAASGAVFGTPVSGNTAANRGKVTGGGAAPQPSGALDNITVASGVTVIDQSLPLDPSGVVYDSQTRRPIAGAQVRLVARDCSFPFDANVNLIGGDANATQTTGANGYYQFLLAPGAPECTYHLEVVPPAGYQTIVPRKASIPPQPTSGFCPAPNCLNPTGLAPIGGVYSVNSAGIATAPQQGQPTEYYLAFRINPAASPSVVNNQIPLDPVVGPSSGLFVDKKSARAIVELGDFLDYEVRVSNRNEAPFTNVTLVDVLPFGFRYVEGSARVAGIAAPDPAGAVGPTLTFALGALAPDATVLVTYRVFIGPGSQNGTGTNAATAASGAVRSNTAQVKVTVVGGVFSDRGYIVGKVFLDCNRNQIQDPGEPGVPGVRLFLEDGTFVISDLEGKYSFYGITARTHALRLDETTMPGAAGLIPLSQRNAGRGNSRFVDLKNGELAKADFATGDCSEEVRSQVEARRSQAEVFVAEPDRALARRLTPDAVAPPLGDVKSRPATGYIREDGTAGQEPPQKPVAPSAPSQPAPAAPAAAPAPAAPPAAADPNYRPLVAENSLPRELTNLPPEPVRRVPQVDIERLLPTLDPALGFVFLKNGDTLPYTQANVSVKGALGSTLKLFANGEEIPATRVGKKAMLPERQIEAWDYIGVALKPGENTLRVAQFDQFGNPRGEASVRVIAPDALAQLLIEAPPSAPGDGVTPVTIRVKLVDKNGVPVTVRTPLTLQSLLGRWEARDFNPTEPGVQVFVEGGAAEFRLLPPQSPGDETIVVSAGVMKAQAKFAYLPELRPLVGIGVVEGAVQLRSLDPKQLLQPRSRDDFDATLDGWSKSDATTVAGGRAALYFKGVVKGEYLLTLAYDSDKPKNEALFRDIQPDNFYPVYGDSAVRGFDAQSTAPLFVRLDKGKSYVQYGDYLTQTSLEARKLAPYNRSLTGLRGHYETGNAVLNAYASYDTSRQISIEFPANGTSGPFQLDVRSGIINSEKVEVLTRDRTQPGMIIKVEPQARFTDYEIETFTGRLLFKGPVPSFDAVLNPKSIRITYEVSQGGDKFWVGGLDGQYKVTEWLEVGGTAVEDKNPLSPYQLQGVNATVRVAEGTYLIGEVARSRGGFVAGGLVPAGNDSTQLPAGYSSAQRIELRHEQGRLAARVYYAEAGALFNNPSALVSQGRLEAGAKAVYKLDAQTNLAAEVQRTGFVAQTGSGPLGVRDSALVGVERDLGLGVRGELGLRYSRETQFPAFALSPQVTNPGAPPVDFTSVRAKLSSAVPYVPQASMFAEYEQAIEDSSKRMAAVGGAYQFADRGRVYGRYEFISSLTAAFGLNPQQRQNQTVVGIDTEYLPDKRLFSEYRLRDAIDGRSADAAIGLRNNWQLAEGLRIGTFSERVRRLAGQIDTNSVAYGAAIDYTANPLWKATGRLEYRDSNASSGWLSTLGLAWKVSEDWTALGRTVLALSENKGQAAGERLQSRVQVGAAWRETQVNEWNALMKYEFRKEEDTTTAASAVDRALNIVSANLNWQPTRKLTLSGRYAAKVVQDGSLGIASDATAQLVSMRVTRDIRRDWDVGVIASLYTAGGFTTQQYGLGAEAGYMVMDNFWLSVGYNLFGFKDKDLAFGDATDQGPFFRIRVKFDEGVFPLDRDDGSFKLKRAE